jgi:hypothetical protein
VLNGLGCEGEEFVRVVAGPDELQSLGHTDVLGVGLPDPLAECRGLPDELLGLLQPAPEQSEAGSAGQDQVTVPGLAGTLEDRDGRLQSGLKRQGPLLEQCVGEQDEPLRVALLVAGGLGDGDDLPGNRGPFVPGARRAQDVVAGEQAGQQGRGIVGTAADLESSLAERPRPGPILGHRVLQLSRQGGGQARLPGVVEPGHDGEGAVELTDDLVAPCGEPGSELGGGERDPGDALGIPGAGGEVGGAAEQAAGVDAAPRPGESVGLGEKHVRHLPVVDIHCRVRSGGPQPPQVTGGLPEGQGGAVALSGPQRPPQGPLRPVEGDGGDEVAGQLGSRSRSAGTCATDCPIGTSKSCW